MTHFNTTTDDADRRVAVIGAGPGGLVAARWLKQAGFIPVIFEAAPALGGQWNPDAAGSGTWAGMRTNTSRVLTAFSDLDHAPEVATYPRQDQVLGYLEDYARQFGLHAHLRLNCPVRRLARRAAGGWTLQVDAPQPQEHVFANVVVATGRHRSPVMPDVPGLQGFAGRLGLHHTTGYAGAQAYRGARVLVAGCSISALEIAADLATGGAAGVVASYRRQRYILPKLISGVPTDHIMFTRAAALAAEAMPFLVQMEGLKAKVLSVAGSPEQFGARRPDPDIAVAGIAQSQGFLPAVAEGRIDVRPWIRAVAGRDVIFADGSKVAVDAILFGTGYDIALPFLDPDVACVLGLSPDGRGGALRLHAQTFHPDLDGLSFLGMFDLVGPYFPVLELQGRWIARCLADRGLRPSPAEMTGALSHWSPEAAGIAQPMQAAAIAFARRLGVDPELSACPDLQRALCFGPLSPVSFRLCGPDALPDAADRTLKAAACFGAIQGPECTPEETAFLRRVLGEPAPAAPRLVEA
ncbi:NAD(P)/FAD-dependent oxidoreductase [Tropicimonas sp. IMCC34043]|uniref:flavin-containing monooxygenase n=1 Tax=Tropicimonas sp. IMCC34043 TaxID=2248760 RepID=UPI000E27A145|nr:FAD-dependent oxidoreductase [Tropicimonas sp. IMCC34043]